MRRQCPKAGDYKIRKGFLFFPKRIGDQIRWLEFAEWKREFMSWGFWNDTQWLN